MTALDCNIDITQNSDGRLAVLDSAVTGQKIFHLERRRFPAVFARRFVSLARGGRWTNGMHKSASVVVARRFDDLCRGAILLNFSCIQHDDMVRNLGHHRQIMSDVNGRSALLLNYRFERLEHLDLSRDIKGCRGFIKHE